MYEFNIFKRKLQDFFVQKNDIIFATIQVRKRYSFGGRMEDR